MIGRAAFLAGWVAFGVSCTSVQLEPKRVSVASVAPAPSATPATEKSPDAVPAMGPWCFEPDLDSAPVRPEILDSSVYLPNWSRVGYRFGEIPPTGVATHNITDFGARPNDGKDDTQAFRRALSALHSVPGRVVLRVPKGRFILSDTLFLERGNFVLQGVGSEPDGSIIEIPKPLNEMSPSPTIQAVDAYLKAENKRVDGQFFSPYSWTGGVFWTRRPATPSPDPSVVLARASTGKRGSRDFTVQDAAGLKAGLSIQINWYNTDGDDSSLLRHIYQLEGQKFGERLWGTPKAPLVSQQVILERVNGNQVRVSDPLLHDLRPGWGNSLTGVQRLTELGIEGLRIEFPEVGYAGHHKERGFNAFYLTDVSHSWMRDVVIRNADSGILTDRADHITLRGIKVGGRAGHYGIHLGDVYAALVHSFEVTLDAWHPISFNTGSRGSVFHNGTVYRARLDQHRGVNHQNLYDSIVVMEDRPQADLFGHGGAPYWGPPHGAFNTFWNIDYRFENETQSPLPLRGPEHAGPARIVGLRSNRSACLAYEGASVSALGKRLSVPSLYDNQRHHKP